MIEPTFRVQENTFPNGISVDRLTQEVERGIDTGLHPDYRIIYNKGFVNFYFKSSLSETEQEDLLDIIANHSGERLPSRDKVVKIDSLSDDEKRLRVTFEPRKAGSNVNFVLPNLCDKCTWYQQALKIENKVLTQSQTDSYTFESGIPYWIDLFHGRQKDEDDISSPYIPVIEADGEVVSIRPPFKDDGGDYEINFEDGSIRFFSLIPTEVKATFYHCNGSLFKINPNNSKRLWVENSEVQFSTDIELTDTVLFQAWGYDPSGQVAPPQKVPLSKKTVYKTADDYIDEARGAYPAIPPFGGDKRGIKHGRLTFPFKYVQLKELFSSYGLEIRIWLENDIPFNGERATATFYCTSHDEEG